jgi:pSer/pThr/pTyr-binding forkhead associated (FHA) protein
MDQDSLTESTLVGPSFAPRLVVTAGEGIGQKFLLRAETNIGRERGNHIILTDPRVSRHHASIVYESGDWVLTDRGSANGTLLNGIPIMSPQVLQEGDIISLGDTELVFQHAPGLAPKPATRPVRRTAPAAPLQPKTAARPSPSMAAVLPWVALVIGGLVCAALVGGALILGPQLIKPTSQPLSKAGEPQVSPTPELVLVYQDDFSNPSSGWDDAFDKYTMKQYGNQKYHIVIQTANLMAWGLANRDISDFVMEVDAAQEEGPDNNGYGLIFRMQDRRNFYRYDISGDGFYLLSKFVNGEWVTLVDWTASPHINKGKGANRLKVSAFGPAISTYANDQLLATVNDKTFSHGNFGFFAGTFSDPNLWISFDDIRVWAPKGELIAEIPTATPVPFRAAPSPTATAQTPPTATPAGTEKAAETPTAETVTSPLPTPTPPATAKPEVPADYTLRNQPKPHGVATLSGRIVFPVYDPEHGTYNIFMANADGSGERILVAEKASQPDLSPNGERIVYRSWDNERRGLILRSLLGSDSRIISSAVEAGRPVFSPDGNVVLYHTREGSDRKPTLFRFDGSQPSVLRNPDDAPIGGQSPAWTPDGQQFVYATCMDGHCALYRSNINGSGTIMISDDMSDNCPAISPDGKTVVFMSNRDGNWELYSVGIDGGPVTRLTKDPANDGIPTWAPDGKTIAFASNRDGQWAIWGMNPDGSNVRQLLPLGGPLEGQVQIDVENSRGWIEEHISWRP